MQRTRTFTYQLLVPSWYQVGTKLVPTVGTNLVRELLRLERFFLLSLELRSRFQLNNGLLAPGWLAPCARTLRHYFNYYVVAVMATNGQP